MRRPTNARSATVVALAAVGMGVAACSGPSGGSHPPATSGRASNAEIVFMAPIKPDLADRGSELVVMNLDGTNRRRLTDNEQQEFLPHFSPDATKLVYTKYLTGSYSDPGSNPTGPASDAFMYDFADGTETNLTRTGKDGYPVWSPDGKRIAFLTRRQTPPLPGPRLWMMSADGSDPHEVGGPSGATDDQLWGDIAWSSDNWILFVVAQGTGTDCFKTRLDKIRPDGTSRTKVTDGGPDCTPRHFEQSGDADPGFSADGKTIYSSRGLPKKPAGRLPAAGGPLELTERKLYAFSSAPWSADKPERDLSLPAQPDCIEGVPRGAPDGRRILLFRMCFDGQSKGGIFVTDTAGSYRTWIADGFGPDWNPRVKR